MLPLLLLHFPSFSRFAALYVQRSVSMVAKVKPPKVQATLAFCAGYAHALLTQPPPTPPGGAALSTVRRLDQRRSEPSGRVFALCFVRKFVVGNFIYADT